MKSRAPSYLGFGNLAFGSMMLAFEAQQVIALRTLKMAQGGPHASREANLMVSEKVETMAQSGGMMLNAMLAGTPDKAAANVLNLYRRKVRANVKRLTLA